MVPNKVFALYKVKTPLRSNRIGNDWIECDLKACARKKWFKIGWDRIGGMECDRI